MNKYIVSFSGGIDSTAMLLRLIELNKPIDQIIFADTTLEFPEMYEWVDFIENYIGQEIIRTKPKKSFDEWFYGAYTRGKSKGERRGFPKVIIPCYWQREAKLLPLQEYTKNANFNYLGITYDEQHRIQNEDKCPILLYPLIEWRWTHDDCKQYLKEKGLEHPLYKNGKFKRTGCWLCPKQSLNSLESLYRYYPELWIKLKQYELDSPNGFRIDKTLNDIEKRIKYKDGFKFAKFIYV